MEKKIISFKGISNVPDDGLNEAGDMAVLMNMRHKGGELVPSKKPSVYTFSTAVKQLLYHEQSGYWLVINSDGDLGVHDLTKKPSYIALLINHSSGKVANKFSLFGNIVIINYTENSEEKVYYCIWRNGGYKHLGGLPEVPDLMASNLQEKNMQRTTEQLYWKRYDKDHKALYNRTVQKGFIDEILNTIYEKRGYIDRAWFRVGLRLFDGSYIALSGIYQLSARRTGDNAAIGIQPGNSMWFPVSGSSGDEVKYTTSVYYFVPTIKVSKIDSNWKDIISSIDVFSTGSIMAFAPFKERGERSGTLLTDEYEWYRKRTAEEFKQAIIDAEFYKVAEFSIDGNKLWEVDNTSPSNLSVQQTLTDIQFNDVFSKKTFVYNSRLHIAGTKERLFKGFAPAYKMDYQAVSRIENPWTVLVYINTENGTKIVKYSETGGAPEDNPELLYYFSYPDSRATKMEIYRMRYDNAGLEVLKIPLTAHRTKNEAYYFGTELSNVTIGDGTGDDNVYKDIPVIVTNYTWESVQSIPGEDAINENKNILKVSAVDNPFYFPTAQTYKFEGEIVELASNAEAISTGQFGQYPLFVFTKEGIWAMQIDTSGQGAYLLQSPFSREVCDDAVCSVSGGVVFTTKRGVMAISGGQVTELSKPLDGLEEMLFNFSGTLAGQIFARAGYSGYEKFEPVPIREYINGAKLAYNYLHNEVILSNPDEKYKYSYVYSLDNQTWGMIDTKFDITTNSYPELVVHENNTANVCTFDDKSNEKIKVVAITRPFTLGSIDFKRISQAGLRTTFKGALNFYVLGSNDGATFSVITGKEAAEVKGENGEVKTYRDLITAMSRSKQYKYFAIAIAGDIEGRISMAELLVDMGFAVNKLR